MIRRFVLLLCLLLAAVVGAQEPTPVQRIKDRAREEFQTGMEVLRGIYRRRIGDLVGSGTRVEICLLDFSMGEEKRDGLPKDTFEIAPYQKRTGVLASRFCTEKERDELLDTLRTAVSGLPHEGGTACHFPIHGIRVWVGNELAFQTSICWYCGNWQMDYGRGAGWENLTDGFRDLKPLMMRLMPIPDDEIKRFKKTHDGPP